MLSPLGSDFEFVPQCSGFLGLLLKKDHRFSDLNHTELFYYSTGIRSPKMVSQQG